MFSSLNSFICCFNALILERSSPFCFFVIKIFSGLHGVLWFSILIVPDETLFQDLRTNVDNQSLQSFSMEHKGYVQACSSVAWTA